MLLPEAPRRAEEGRRRRRRADRHLEETPQKTLQTQTAASEQIPAENRQRPRALADAGNQRGLRQFAAGGTQLAVRDRRKTNQNFDAAACDEIHCGAVGCAPRTPTTPSHRAGVHAAADVPPAADAAADLPPAADAAHLQLAAVAAAGDLAVHGAPRGDAHGDTRLRPFRLHRPRPGGFLLHVMRDADGPARRSGRARRSHETAWSSTLPDGPTSPFLDTLITESSSLLN